MPFGFDGALNSADVTLRRGMANFGQEYFDRPHHQFKNCIIVPGENETYTVVFNFGSIVFFNFSAKERAHHIKLATKYSEEPSSVPCEESYGLVVLTINFHILRKSVLRMSLSLLFSKEEEEEEEQGCTLSLI